MVAEPIGIALALFGKLDELVGQDPNCFVLLLLTFES
jgi:hypothetical protein